jgi:succinate dehydrogenase / fumarate reductase cytochrome b subunit
MVYGWMKEENMAFGKYTGLKGWLYKGSMPYYAFSIHRLTGMGIILFVGLHVAASFMMQRQYGTLGIEINSLYELWWFQIIVVFCVLFHVFNGVRVVILDIWPKLIKFEREAVYLLWAVFVPVYLLTVYVIVMKAITGSA